MHCLDQSRPPPAFSPFRRFRSVLSSGILHFLLGCDNDKIFPFSHDSLYTWYVRTHEEYFLLKEWGDCWASYLVPARIFQEKFKEWFAYQIMPVFLRISTLFILVWIMGNSKATAGGKIFLLFQMKVTLWSGLRDTSWNIFSPRTATSWLVTHMHAWNGWE